MASKKNSSSVENIILLLLLSYALFGQSISKKQLTGKWSSNLLYHNHKIADTIYLTKNGKRKNLYLTGKNETKAEAFRMYCGKSAFKDNFKPKPPKWVATGSWSIKIINEKIVLSVANKNQAYILTLLSANKTEYRFIIKEMWTVNAAR